MKVPPNWPQNSIACGLQRCFVIVGLTHEAIIAAEAQLTKEKIALENFQYDIFKFTNHICTYMHQIMRAGQQLTKQHFILVFSALKEVEEEEFKMIFMKFYQEWYSGKGDGSKLSMLQVQVKADSEYKRLTQLGQWNTKNKASDLLGERRKDHQRQKVVLLFKLLV
jgi:hypothetical protein